MISNGAVMDENLGESMLARSASSPNMTFDEFVMSFRVI